MFPLMSELIRTEEVQLARLDTILDSVVSHIPAPRIFLKMDTQGSDIDVFREIGADYPTYFSLDDPHALDSVLRQRLELVASATPWRTPARQWLSWADSARMLLEKVTSGPQT